MKCGKKIKALREQKGWTQVFLAQKANITPAMLCLIEKEKSAGSLEVLLNIAKVLNVKINDLLK
ncbi:helix-turn-helix transcriptional regulator [uncultured Megamonas sp.]|uniref:helix-turn-helix domain-containing protein n=1 Tax=uncultured Megamonas sp. TaxID=286140 RepID=UPI00259AF4BC|nr:helix-turn-helix transcriptional regulator [uncultured Megamonas sp.]